MIFCACSSACELGCFCGVTGVFCERSGWLDVSFEVRFGSFDGFERRPLMATNLRRNMLNPAESLWHKLLDSKYIYITITVNHSKDTPNDSFCPLLAISFLRFYGLQRRLKYIRLDTLHDAGPVQAPSGIREPAPCASSLLYKCNTIGEAHLSSQPTKAFS